MPWHDQAGMRNRILALGSIALAAIGPARAADPACSAYTGPHTTALVELYTSEGCDTCTSCGYSRAIQIFCRRL